MADIKWIKLDTNMFNVNRKIKQIELMPEGDTILIIWFKLMTLAGLINDGGYIYLTPDLPYTEETLANELRRPLPVVKIALTVFENFGMIETSDKGIVLTSWEKYQNVEGMDKIRKQTRERVAKHRENKRLEAGNATCNVTVTHSNAIEEEGEKDLEEEKEYSFYHSAEKTDFLKEETKRKYLGGSLGKGVVLLSDEQINDLLNKLSIEEFDHYVSVVADCELSGKPYKKKTHYQAILDMVAKDRGVK